MNNSIDNAEQMAIPVNSRQDMDTSESPTNEEGTYIDVRAKGTIRPIHIRPDITDPQSQPSTSSVNKVDDTPKSQLPEFNKDDKVVLQSKLSTNIEATPADDTVTVESDYSVSVPVPEFDGCTDYLLQNKTETYKLTKNQGKKKVGSTQANRQRRSSGLSLVPDTSPYGSVKRFNDFTEVRGSLPQLVDISGKRYKLQVDFIPDESSCASNDAANAEETLNLLEAGSVDRPPEFSLEANACTEPLNLTFKPLNLTSKPLDLSLSQPSNLGAVQQGMFLVDHFPSPSPNPDNLNANKEFNVHVNQVGDSSSPIPSFVQIITNNEPGNKIPIFTDMAVKYQPCIANVDNHESQVPNIGAEDQLYATFSRNQTDTAESQVPSMANIGAEYQPFVTTSGNQAIPAENQISKQNHVVEGNLPNITNLTLHNYDQPNNSKPVIDKKMLQDMFKASGMSPEEQMRTLILLYAQKTISNAPQAQSTAPIDLNLPGTSNLPVTSSLHGTSRVPAPPQAVVPDEPLPETVHSNPLPNLQSLELADNNGGFFMSEHERTKLIVKSYLSDR